MLRHRSRGGGQGPAPMSEAPSVDPRRLLTDLWLFRGLGEAELERLTRHLHRRRFQRGEPIFRKGDPGDSVMAVGSGRVRISSSSAEGRTAILNYINPGEIFGEIALLDGKERTADAYAAEATELLVLSRRDFLPLLERRPELCMRLIDVLCDRLRRTSEQVEDLTFLVGKLRVAKALLRFAASHGRGTKTGGVRIDMELPQKELGENTGMTRENVNKILSEWRRAGLLDENEKQIITIVDRDRFERMVADIV